MRLQYVLANIESRSGFWSLSKAKTAKPDNIVMKNVGFPRSFHSLEKPDLLGFQLDKISTLFLYYEVGEYYWWIPAFAGMTLLFCFYYITCVCGSLICHAALDAASNDFLYSSKNNSLLRQPPRTRHFEAVRFGDLTARGTV
jgi:hypothetical protein